MSLLLSACSTSVGAGKFPIAGLPTPPRLQATAIDGSLAISREDIARLDAYVNALLRAYLENTAALKACAGEP